MESMLDVHRMVAERSVNASGVSMAMVLPVQVGES